MKQLKSESSDILFNSRISPNFWCLLCQGVHHRLTYYHCVFISPFIKKKYIFHVLVDLRRDKFKHKDFKDEFSLENILFIPKQLIWFAKVRVATAKLRFLCIELLISLNVNVYIYIIYMHTLMYTCTRAHPGLPFASLVSMHMLWKGFNHKKHCIHRMLKRHFLYIHLWYKHIHICMSIYIYIYIYIYLMQGN